MEQLTVCDEIVVVPPPRRQGKARALGIHAVQLIAMLGLLPLCASVVALALFCRPRLPSGTARRGRPIVYSDACVMVIALITRLWNLSERDMYDWLTIWPALAAPCGLPQGRVIHHAHLNRRVRRWQTIRVAASQADEPVVPPTPVTTRPVTTRAVTTTAGRGHAGDHDHVRYQTVVNRSSNTPRVITRATGGKTGTPPLSAVAKVRKT